jgi:hypothetical protein
MDTSYNTTEDLNAQDSTAPVYDTGSTPDSDGNSSISKVIGVVAVIFIFGAIGVLLYFLFRPSDSSKCTYDSRYDAELCSESQAYDEVMAYCGSHDTGACKNECKAFAEHFNPDPDSVTDCEFLKDEYGECAGIMDECELCVGSTGTDKCTYEHMLNVVRDQIYCDMYDSYYNCPDICQALYIRRADSGGKGDVHGERCSGVSESGEITDSGYNYCRDNNNNKCDCSKDELDECASRTQFEDLLDDEECNDKFVANHDTCNPICEAYEDHIAGYNTCSNDTPTACRYFSEYCCATELETCQNPDSLLAYLDDTCPSPPSPV